MRNSLAISYCLGLAVLSGCAATGSLPPQTPSFAQNVARGTSTQHLYVAGASSVSVYALGASSPARTISNLKPTAMAFDSLGNLYVADVPAGKTGSVNVYRPNAHAAALVISSGVHYPNALVVSPSRELYVSNYYAKITAYAPAKKTPAFNITSLFSVAAVVDSSGNFYDAQLQGPYGGRGGNVKIYARGSQSVMREITQKIDNPAALALDAAQNLYVINAGNVTVYKAGGTTLLRTISSGLHSPSALALDASGNLYVADKVANTVSVFAPNGTKLLRKITQGVQKPTALALDAAHSKLYVANSNSVTVYATATGSLDQTITKGISKPLALELGP